jgi:hypothetical protein
MTMTSPNADPQHERNAYAAAVKFVAVFVVIALLALVASVLWVSTCKSGSGDGALDNCTALQRNTLAVGSAAVLLVGGIWAFVRTYQVWRAQGRWLVWQGAGWFLLVLMLVVFTTTTPIALLS